MKRALTVLSLALLLVACATSPLGRRQLLLLPEDQVSQMGVTAWSQLKSQQRTVSGAQADYVRCVTDAITSVLDTRQQWETSVFADDTANAFALPGGKIGVHTGLLEVAQTPAQLAAVIGHEVGHVLAQHSNERLSIQFATATGLQLAQVLGGETTQEKQMLFGLLGVGSQVGIALPFSRKHESEADIIGLQLMAKAGFDPRESVTLWQNMARANGDGGIEFLSTHPANATRIRGLQENMDEALAIHRQAVAAGRQPDCR